MLSRLTIFGWLLIGCLVLGLVLVLAGLLWSPDPQKLPKAAAAIAVIGLVVFGLWLRLGLK